jgi:hypothetical protein
MHNEIERNLGVQPIAEIMARDGLQAGDLVAASSEQLTYKMVARACKGRRLTDNSKSKVLNGLNLANDKEYSLSELFNY